MNEERAAVQPNDAVVQGACGLTADKKSRATRAKPAPAGLAGESGADQHITSALRSAYEEAVQEDVPSEFLELLGKLN